MHGGDDSEAVAEASPVEDRIDRLWELAGRRLPRPQFAREARAILLEDAAPDATSSRVRIERVARLAAGVAHELNEPLGAILGYAQLIQKSFGLPDQTARDLERIVKASLHARQIVRNLLLFSRQVAPRLAPTDLNRVVREVLFFMRARCASAEVRIDLALQTKLPRIAGDGTQLQQVVINLIANAVQSMPQGGTLTVTSRVIADEVSLVVADSGVGMTPELAARIFDPFVTTREVGQGTGLGLAVLHGIVEAHRGRVVVRSEPGAGSSFDVRFPRLDQ